MGYFARTSETEAAYDSTRGIHYRLLAQSADGDSVWLIIPEMTPAQPTYYAIPNTAVAGADWYGFAICRGSADDVYGGDGEVVGWAENLSDAARPVEHDLVNRGVTLEAIW
jgi:hypothetical protein